MLQQHLLGMRCYTIRLTALILALEARSAQSLRLVDAIISKRDLNTLVRPSKFFKGLKPIKQKLLHQRSLCLYIVERH